MNTKDNRRARDTDERIIRAFYGALQKKKTVSKITVREICEEAGVNRSTFYAHYEDVYDLLEKVEKHMAKSLTESFLNAMNEGGDLGQGFESLFAFVKEYREFYAIYLNEARTAGVIGLAREVYADKVSNISWRDIGLSSEEEMAYQEEFYLAGISAMMRRWVNTGCKETPREMLVMLEHQYGLWKIIKG